MLKSLLEQVEIVRTVRYSESCFDSVINKLKLDCELLQSSVEHKILCN